MRTSMTARDIMSAPVISVQASTPVGEIAALLRDRRIGGLPVITDGSLQGMVTQRDLMRRHEIGTDAVREPRRWWQGTRAKDASARAYVKSHGRTASHVMTRPVHVVGAAAALAQVALAFELHAIGRAPVVEAGRVVGMVARADLVKALADQPPNELPPTKADDEAIRRMLVDELSRQDWWNSGWENLYVVSGVVIFKGVVENDAHRAAARVAAENIPGVRGVVDDRVTSTEAVEMVV
jgi:CBS domain-containing protein